MTSSFGSRRALEDYEDLRVLREEKAAYGGEPARPLGDVLKNIGD
jgi:hypothetical protein